MDYTKDGRAFFEDNNYLEFQPREKTYRQLDATCRGLKLQVTPKGVYSWVYHGLVPGFSKPLMKTLGRCFDLTPSQARKKADTLRTTGSLGGKAVINPVINPASAPVIKTVLTFKEAAIAFMKDYPHESKDEERNKKVNFKRITAAWGELPVTDLTEEMVIDYLDGILKEPPQPNRPPGPKKATRNSVLRTLKRFWKWGRKRYGLGPNPCEDIEYLNIKGRKERLYYPDLKLLGAAVKRSTHLYRWGVIIPLLCGGRIGALENIEQGRYDSVKRRYEFQDVDGTKELDYLYISPHAQWCLDQLPRVSAALIREAWEAIREDAAFDRRLIRHDFRRTFKSLGSDLEEDHIKLEVLIGHTLGGVTAIYHHNDWRVLGQVNDRVCDAIWKAMKLSKLPVPVKLVKKPS